MIAGSLAFSVFAGSQGAPWRPWAGAAQPPSAQQIADSIAARAAQLGRGDPLAVLRLRLAASAVHPSAADHRAALAELLLGARALVSLDPMVGEVTSLAFDGSARLAVGGRDGVQLATGDTTTMTLGQPLRDLNGVSAVVYSSGELWAASSEGPRPAAFAGGGSTVPVYALVRLGSTGWAATTRDGRLVVWNSDVIAGPPNRTLAEGLGPTAAVAATSNGRYLLVPGSGGMDVLDAVTGQRAASIAVSGVITSLSTDADGRRVLIGHGDQASIVDVTNPTTPKPGPSLTPAAGATIVAIAPNGKTAATVGGGVATVWQLADNGDPAAVATLPASDARALAYSEDSSLLATGSTSTVQTWSIAELLTYQTAQVNPTSALQTHLDGDPITYTELSSDGSYLTTSGDRTKPATVWRTHRLNSETPILERHSTLDGPVRQASTVGGLTTSAMITVNPTGQTTLWSIANAASVNRGRITTGVDAAAVSPDHNNAVTVASVEATVWGLAPIPQAQGTLSYPSPVTALAFAPQGTALIGGHRDGTVTVHTIDLRNARADRHDLASATPSPVDAVAVDDHTDVAIATHDDGAVTVWDLSSSTADAHVTITSAAGPGPHHVWMDADGDFALISHADGTTTVWSLTNRRAPARLAAVIHQAASLPVTISADAHRAVTIGQNNEATLWNLRPVLDVINGPIARACQLAALTHEWWRDNVTDPTLANPCLAGPIPALDNTNAPRTSPSPSR